MPYNVIGRWEGGEVVRARGRDVYVIRRRVHGRRYSIPLHDVGSLKQALTQLAAFEADPRGYRAHMKALREGASAVDAVVIEPKIVARFLEQLRKEKTSDKYRSDTQRYLGDWIEALDGADLRFVTVRDFKSHLYEWSTAERRRVVALRSFCTWLRGEGILKRKEDASMDLAIKTSKPAQDKAIEGKGYEMEHVAALYRQVDDQSVRDVIRVQAFTGMHGTELRRFANPDTGKVRIIDDHPHIAGVLSYWHKSDKIHYSSVNHATLAAALRLRELPAAAARDMTKLADEVRKVTAFVASRVVDGRTQRYLRSVKQDDRRSLQDIDRYFGTNGMAWHWTTQAHDPRSPQVPATWEQWERLKAFLGLSDEMDGQVKRIHVSLSRRRLRVPSERHVNSCIEEAAKAAKLPPINVGALRHSLSNWLEDHGTEVRYVTNAGVDHDRIAAILGHESSKTTKKFYLKRGKVPPMGLIPLELYHPDDPPVQAPKAHLRSVS